MDKLYIGIDIGSISIKGVLIDEYDNIIRSSYIYINGLINKNLKEVLKELTTGIDKTKYIISGIGLTGIGRKMGKFILDADIAKNEIESTYRGVIKLYKDIDTIIDIGGLETKIINIKEGNIFNYKISDNCLGGNGAFLMDLANRWEININDISKIDNIKDLDIDEQCNIFLEKELINNLYKGYSKEELIKAVCHSISKNSTKNLINTKGLIILVGGVSKNKIVVKEIEKLINRKIIVNKNSHLLGAYGISLIVKDNKINNNKIIDSLGKNIDNKIKEFNKYNIDNELVKNM